MRLVPLVVAAILTSVPAGAQNPQPSPVSSAPAPSSADSGELPISLDRIREGLSRPAPRPGLRHLDRQADFKTEIVERRKIDELLATLDFRTGPTPAGGLYMYEQQRSIWSSVDHPLLQPYAAFSGGELITIAIENLVAKYLGGQVKHAWSNVQRAHAEEAARVEVRHAIADYCTAQPDGGADIYLCMIQTGAR